MNGILSVSFLVLAVLSYFDKVNVNEYYVFGLTIGAILISMSSCFEYESKKNINYYIKICFIFLGWTSIIAIGVLRAPILDTIIVKFDDKTLLFLSLGYTIIGTIVSDINTKNKVLKSEESIRKEYNKEIEELYDLIKSIKKD